MLFYFPQSNIHRNERGSYVIRNSTFVTPRHYIFVDFHVWEWEDENGRWNPYNITASVLLEKELMDGGNTVQIEAYGRNYTIDIAKKIQTNDDTGVQRDVQRQKSGTWSSEYVLLLLVFFCSEIVRLSVKIKPNGRKRNKSCFVHFALYL